MADWYCDYTNGNDTTGSGTSGSPYQTLQKCVDSATRGDTIYVANTSAQVFSSALSFGTGYTAIGTGETLITGWDNGGSLSLTVPGTAGTIPAGKIDATGLASGWITSLQPYVTVSNLIIDSGSSSIAQSSGYWNFYRCHFLGTGKASGYFATQCRSFHCCLFEGFGITQSNIIVGCCFKDVNAYAIFDSGTRVIGNLFIGSSSYTGSSPLVDPSGSDGLIFGNTFISKSARTGPLLLLYRNHYVINNTFQGCNGVGGVGIDANSNYSALAGNVFHDCTSNVTNDSLVRYLSPNVTASAALYTDAGTNQWEASSELESAYYPTGYIGTSTQTYKDAGAIEYLSTGTGATNVAAAKFTRLE